MILFCAGPVTFVSSLVWGLGHRVGSFVPRALHTGPQLMVALSKATGAETLASQSKEVELWGGFYVRLKKSLLGHLRGCHGKTARQLSETLSKEVVQAKKELRAPLPSRFPFLLHPLFCLSPHLVYLASEAFFARDLDEFCLWNSNGDGGYLWLIHTVFNLWNSCALFGTGGPIGCMELAGSEPGAVGEDECEGKDDCVGPARRHSP